MFPFVAVLLAGCGGGGPSEDGERGVFYYAAGDPFVEKVMRAAEERLPFGIRLIGSNEREDIKVRYADDGYFRGCAHVCSRRGWVNINFDSPSDIFEKSVWSVVHEVGHMAGSHHRESPEAIMHTGILHHYRDHDLNWEMESLREIENCG